MPEDLIHFPVTPVALKMAVSIGIFLLIALMNVRSIMTDKSLEITTSAALMLNYPLGVLVGMGHIFTPVAAAIVTTMLLAWKTELNRFAGAAIAGIGFVNYVFMRVNIQGGHALPPGYILDRIYQFSDMLLRH